MHHSVLALHSSSYLLIISPYSWWLQCLRFCQDHVLWWGALSRLCFANKFISSFYSLIHHSSFYKQGGDPCEDEMGISGGSPNEQCFQINKSPWNSEFPLQTLVHTHKCSHFLPPSKAFFVPFHFSADAVYLLSSYPGSHPTKSLEVVFSWPLGTSQNLTLSFFLFFFKQF